VSFQVGRWALDRSDAMILGDLVDEVISALYDFDFMVVALVSDGAAENCGLVKHLTSTVQRSTGAGETAPDGVRVRDFLTADESAVWEAAGRNIELMVAFPHPRDRSQPIFVVADMPHTVKTYRCVMFASSLARARRCPSVLVCVQGGGGGGGGGGGADQGLLWASASEWGDDNVPVRALE
jgi:hypothetical protein